jgi:TolB-like protein/tetratricopeptide (TPR) repeat protein/tRNA A-37 threonylcarbamoyl transferase component Bud32
MAHSGTCTVLGTPDREVALKLLPARSDADDARTSSIIEEGRLLARVRHPNVVTIYGAERIGNTVGLWMELIDGKTVEQRLAQSLPFQSSEVIEIGIQICRAVSAVHGAGLLHRDIKAQNVMLSTDGRAVLMDFGTSWEMSESSTSTVALAGTPLYLAPEVLRSSEATIQSDVYSIGVLLYHMLTGTYPVRARNLPDLRLAHERRDSADVLAIRRDVPRRLAGIIERAIHPDAERRFESVDELATALGTLQPRRPVIPLKYAIAIAAAVVLGGLVLSGGARRLRHGPEATQAGLLQASAVPGRSDDPAIAVLPLKNLSTETGSEEFADGFTEEIINGLAANDHLQVRSRTSSFAFKNNRGDLRDVATRLNVSFVLDGSIRRSGNHVHIDAQLLRASTGVTLWNESFDRDVGDAFAIRNQIARNVVERLGVKGGVSRRAYDLSPEAYGRYLAARALLSRRGPGVQKAIEYFQQVIAMAPEFAPAYAGIADAYAHMSLPTYQGVPTNKAQGLMRTAALKALELDPDLAEAHAAMGIVSARDLDWSSSQRDFQQAIALNPSLSQVYTNYSFFTLRPLRRFDEAERLLKVALKSDPLSLDVWREMGQLYFTVGRYDEAIDLLQRVRAVDPRFPTADVVLARALACSGRVNEALALYDLIESQKPDGAPLLSRAPEGAPHYQAYAYVKAGRRSDAERLAAENDQYAYRATIIYAALGDIDRAFEALQRTADREPQRVPLLLTWPELASLRGDPRFAAIQKRFGVP